MKLLRRIYELYLFRKRKVQWKAIKQYLLHNYSAVVSDYKVKENRSVTEQALFPIWVCWWQGAESMPAIVKTCYVFLQRNANGHPVHLITRDNYKNYVDIPDFFFEKVENGIITLTHLSDILRIFLIHQHGGLWVDATILVTKPLPSSFDMELFSVKREDNHAYASQSRWSLYLFYGKKGNLLFDFLQRFIQEYWIKETKMVDYLLLDYAIIIAYEHIPAVRVMLDQIPYNNPRIRELRRRFNEAYDEMLFKELCSHNYFHKLSYKYPYEEFTNSGKRTFYSYIIGLSKEQENAT